MKVADNLDRHKISNEFEFRPDRTIDFGVTCPLVPKTPIYNLVWSVVCLVLIETLWNLQITWMGKKSWMSLNSGQIGLLTLENFTFHWVPKNTIFDLVHIIACLILIVSLWKLQITWTGIKTHMSLNLGKIRLFTLELLALECQKNIFDFVHSIACIIFIQSLWNLQLNRTGIKYSTSWKLGHFVLFTFELYALHFWYNGSQMSDCCPLGFLFLAARQDTINLRKCKRKQIQCLFYCLHLLTAEKTVK